MFAIFTLRKLAAKIKYKLRYYSGPLKVTNVLRVVFVS